MYFLGLYLSCIGGHFEGDNWQNLGDLEVDLVWEIKVDEGDFGWNLGCEKCENGHDLGVIMECLECGLGYI